MENQSTPIENLMSMGDDTPNEGSSMSASEQILQKYIELENQTPERKQINEGQEQRQLDPAIAEQHRMLEMERAMQYQMENQQNMPQNNNVASSSKESGGFMSNLKDMAGGLMDLFSGPLLVVILFVLFNLGVVDKTLTRIVPLFANEYGNMNLKGVIVKAILVGIIFFIVKLFL